MIQAPEQVKVAADITGIVTITAAWLGVFSTVMTILATLATFVWGCIRIYETDTVQKWLGKK